MDNLYDDEDVGPPAPPASLTPSWSSLAVSHFTFKKFVKASDKPSEDSVKTQTAKIDDLYGDDDMDFYNDIVKEVKVEKKEIKAEIKNDEGAGLVGGGGVVVLEESDEEIRMVDPLAKKKLVNAAQDGDVSAVIKFIKDGVSPNLTDRFGWTLLMIASAAGHAQIVQILLDAGASLDVCDKSGKNAANIARLKGNFGIEGLLLNWNTRSKDKPKRKKLKAPDNFESCEVCNDIYPTKDRKKHKASLTHQLELDKSQMNINPGFGISQTNKGYQMLKKGGWDGMTGLGESGKGRLFPVKSVLKTDRSGVKEGANKSAKITHFAANDKESVNNRIRVQRKIKPSNEENVNNEIFLRGALGDF